METKTPPFHSLPHDVRLGIVRERVEMHESFLREAKNALAATPSPWTRVNFKTAQRKLEFSKALVAQLEREDEFLRARDEAEVVVRSVVFGRNVFIGRYSARRHRECEGETLESRR
jgi:hypothetical protein